MWIYILLGILALFFLIAMIPVGITFICDAGSPAAYDPEAEEAEHPIQLFLRIFFLRLKILPGKEKKVNIKDFRIEKFRKRRRKEEKALRKKEKKKNKGKKEKEEVTEETGKEPPKKKKRSVTEIIEFVRKILREVVSKVLKKFWCKYIRLNIDVLHIRLGTGDAAKTAVLYGGISQSLVYLFDLLSETSHTTLPTEENVSLIPDFSAEDSEIHLKIRAKLRVWQIISIGITALAGYLKVMK